LHIRANARIISDYGAADAYRDSFGANESPANRRNVCYSYKSVANHGAVDGAS
jgi:hypothetical protein